MDASAAVSRFVVLCEPVFFSRPTVCRFAAAQGGMGMREAPHMRVFPTPT